MKNTTLILFFLVLTVVAKAQLDTAAYTGSYAISINSQETTLSNSSNVQKNSQPFCISRYGYLHSENRHMFLNELRLY